jgi:hypothetical protein
VTALQRIGSLPPLDLHRFRSQDCQFAHRNLFESTNPHAWLYLDGKDESGKLTSWRFEMGASAALFTGAEEKWS